MTSERIPECEPPRSSAKPRRKAPAGATDCHFHVFGPHDRYGLNPARNYTPCEASIEAYCEVAQRLGLTRRVIVQPSPYGTDNSRTLDAVEQLGREHTRAIVVVDDTVDDNALRDLDRQGARGVRFNCVNTAGAPLDGLQKIARRVAPLGWHIQVFAPGASLPELAPTLAALPVPVVIDHMGMIPAGQGAASLEYQALARLLASGTAWVKLCGYRISAEGPPYTDLLAPAKALIAEAPERCVWGTDWPHPFLEGRPMPDDGILLDLLYDWAADGHPADSILQRILIDNPARLYGFA